MKQIFLLILLLAFTRGFSQQTDILGNTFFLKENILLKKDFSNNTNYQYENANFGEISSFDVSNPFQVLIFFKYFNSCVILDDKFSETSSINFEKYGIYASLICTSSNNGIWIYDDINKSIFHFDINSQEISCKKSFSIESKLIFLFEQDGYIIFISNENTLVLNNLCGVTETYKLKYKNHKINRNKIEIQSINGDKYLFIDGKLIK